MKRFTYYIKQETIGLYGHMPDGTRWQDSAYVWNVRCKEDENFKVTCYSPQQATLVMGSMHWFQEFSHFGKMMDQIKGREVEG